MMNSVAIGKVTKTYKPDQGIKAEMKLLNGKTIFLLVKRDNSICEAIKEAAGKSEMICLYGDLRLPGKDATNKKPILDVKGINEGAIVIAAGRLTREPELKYTTNGKPYTKDAIAINYGWGDQKETDFMNLTVWGNEKEKNKAVALAEKGAKGQQILVCGSLDQNEKDGKEYVDVTVSEYELLSFPKKDNAGETSATNKAAGGTDWDNLGTSYEAGEDEIPF